MPGIQHLNILKECSYTFRENAIYAVVGESGVGKSTLLKCTNNLVPIDGGYIRFHGEDIVNLPPESVRRNISYLTQSPAFVGSTVEENFLFAQQFSHRSDVDYTILLEKVHLGNQFLQRKVDDLSVGQKQRVCLARTLVAQPQILLLDEPTAALDEETAGKILQVIKEVSQLEKLLTIFVTHIKAQAQAIGDIILRLSDGCLTEIK